jgi:CRP/FNR family transcriptional regulator, cyclic AMP receptor protein
VFRISARALIAAARRDARVAWAIAEELNRRLYEVLGQTAVNAFGSVRQCVAAHLLDLASGRQRPGGRLMAHGPGAGSGACCPAGLGVGEPAR